jgi:hypothetical protein
VLFKKKKSTTNPLYDNECKISRKYIRGDSNTSLKYNKINIYKSLIKRGNKGYINRKKENPFHLFKINPKKFRRKIITHKTKENNKILLKEWN